MSFILDALKKSDADRQRQNTPGIADFANSTEPSSSPRWLWILGALLSINLLILAVVLLRPDSAPDAGPTTAKTPPAPTQVGGEAIDGAPEPSADFSDAAMEPAVRQPPPAAVAKIQPASTPVVTTTATPAGPKPPSTLTQAYPTFNEYRAGGGALISDLHLDIHVYSALPADRFVFVNMSKYKEQASLTEGPRVKEIVPEGVILEYLGTAFLLPRQ